MTLFKVPSSITSLSIGSVFDINPFVFEIESNKITIIGHGLSIKQLWADHPSDNRWSQICKIEIIGEDTIRNIKNQVDALPNAQLWTWADMSESHVEDEVMKLLIETAKEGDPLAQYKLGQLHRWGRYTRKDNEESIKWFTKAAEQGHVEAQHILGDIYLEKRNHQNEAIKWYTKAADQGYEKSQSALGNIYQYEKDFTNLEQAAKWYRKAAERGNEEAQINLNIICVDSPQLCD